MKYNAQELRNLAARLESMATWTVYMWTAIGIVAGGAVLGFVGGVFGQGLLGLIVGLVGGGVMGYMHGEHIVLMIRLEAQLALCHIEIEENTRTQQIVTVETKAAVADEPEVPDSTEPSPTAPEVEARTEEASPRASSGAGATMGIDPAEWTPVDIATVSGSYKVDSGNTGIPWVQKAFEAKTVTLTQRHGGLWLEFAPDRGELLSESSFRWTTSDRKPGMLLILDSIGNPRVLLRRLG